MKIILTLKLNVLYHHVLFDGIGFKYTVCTQETVPLFYYMELGIQEVIYQKEY